MAGFVDWAVIVVAEVAIVPDFDSVALHARPELVPVGVVAERLQFELVACSVFVVDSSDPVDPDCCHLVLVHLPVGASPFAA